MKLRNSVLLKETPFNRDEGQTKSQREMQVLKDFVYERINKITTQQRQSNTLITLELDMDSSFNSVFNEDENDEDIIVLRVSWSAVDDVWEIVSYFCLSSPVFHQDDLDDFNVEVLSFFIDVSRRHEILVDYDPLGFLDKWSEILSAAIFNGSKDTTYMFRIDNQEQIKRNAKDALTKVKSVYD